MSPSRKSPSNLSTEELLASLDNLDSISEQEEIPEDPIFVKVQKFLSTFDISSGKHKVRKPLLHKLYSSWDIDRRIPSGAFNLAVSSYLEQYDLNFLYLNRSFIHISNLLIKKIKKPKEKSTRVVERVEEFLKREYINSGNTWIQSSYIYEHYKYLRCSPRITIKSFNSILKIFFTYKNTGKLYVKIKKEKAEELKRLYPIQKYKSKSKS